MRRMCVLSLVVVCMFWSVGAQASGTTAVAGVAAVASEAGAAPQSAILAGTASGKASAASSGEASDAPSGAATGTVPDAGAGAPSDRRTQDQAGRSLVLSGARVAGGTIVATFLTEAGAVPEGAYAAVNIDVTQHPQDSRPDVVPGFPESRLVFHQPGEYVVVFRLNKVSKSSCAGVNAAPLMEREERIVIAPAPDPDTLPATGAASGQ